MTKISFDLPIYYMDTDGKMKLFGLNRYERMHYHKLNRLKKDYYSRVRAAVGKKIKIDGKYTVSFKLYYKNAQCDAPNIIAAIEKVTMDALQLYGIVNEDNVKHYTGASWEVVGKDIERPRVEIEIRGVA